MKPKNTKVVVMDSLVIVPPEKRAGIKAEESFYKPPKRGQKRRGGSQEQDGSGEEADEMEMGEGSYDEVFAESRCAKVSYENYYQQIDDYTEHQMDALSKEIRRHPSIALKSYHFLEKGLSTKILHQCIRIALSTVFMLAVICVLVRLPLPSLAMRPTDGVRGGNGKFTNAADFESNQFVTAEPTLAPFKREWGAFSTGGISNFLCYNFNFNAFDSMTVDNKVPDHGSVQPSSNDQGKVHYDGNYNQEFKNVKIFMSTVLFGCLAFVLWITASRLSEKEIIMNSSLFLQFVHSILTIFTIPLVNMIFLALVLLYFIQTLVNGPVLSTEQVSSCVERVNSSLNEITSFSPLRELILGSVGIVMRLANAIFKYPISSLELRDSSNGALNDLEMKFLSLLWCIIIGSSLYHFGMVISYLYSIFRERTVKPTPATNGQAPSQSSSPSVNEAPALLSLDLKFLPSFIPEVLLTQNFIIVFLWTVISCCLWAFGSPIPGAHEGEVFYVFLSTSALIQSIYQLSVILQKKETIQKLHQDNDVYKLSAKAKKSN